MRSSILASIGFVAGVASASALLSAAGPDKWSVSWDSALAISPLLGFSILSTLKSRSKSSALISLFLCGALCYFTSVLAPGVNRLEGLRLHLPDLGFTQARTEALSKALLSGDRSSLDRQTVKLFKSAGASHILALSGLHLGIISGILEALLGVLGRSAAAMKLRKFLCICFSAAYCILCGASPSLVRACFFTFLNSLSQLSPDRSFGPADCLFTAAALQLSLDPVSIDSPAFRMSYLAILGMALILPVLKELDIWNPIAVALSCQICTAPYAFFEFGSLPGFFLLSNLLALPLCEALIILFLACYLTTIIPGSVPGILLTITEKTCDMVLFLLDVISSL